VEATSPATQLTHLRQTPLGRLAATPRGHRTLALIAASPLLGLAGFFLLIATRAPVDLDHAAPVIAQASSSRPRILVSSPWTRNDAYALHIRNRSPTTAHPSEVTTTLQLVNQYLATNSTPAPVEKTVESTDLIWPIESTTITSDFGRRSDPLHGDRRAHQGVDIRADEGTPVLAAAAGTVVHAEQNARGGLYVKLDHGNDTSTSYAHLSNIAVVPGERVQAGQIIGLSGATGRVTGPHLHFEVSEAGKHQDPLSYDWKVLSPEPEGDGLATSEEAALP
jgi:murein DD-endopeptidase MepM/ murein hydrolase activator NlpD